MVPSKIFNYVKYGAFNPFFRGHANQGTKRREPWCFSDETREEIKKSIELRYKLIVFWYTLFFENTISAIPVLTPFWASFRKNFKTDHNYSEGFVVGGKIVVFPFLNKKRYFKK